MSDRAAPSAGYRRSAGSPRGEARRRELDQPTELARLIREFTGEG